MIGCLRTRVRKQPIIVFYFESENELKFYNLEARSLGSVSSSDVSIYVVNVCHILFRCQKFPLNRIFSAFTTDKYSD